LGKHISMAHKVARLLLHDEPMFKTLQTPTVKKAPKLAFALAALGRSTKMDNALENWKGSLRTRTVDKLRTLVFSLVTLFSTVAAHAEPAVARPAALPAPPVGSVQDLSITVQDVGDPQSGVRCTYGNQVRYNKTNRFLVANPTLTGFGGKTIPGRPFTDERNGLTYELRDQAGKVLAVSDGTGRFTTLGAKVCVIGSDAPSSVEPIPAAFDAAAPDDGSAGDGGIGDAGSSDAGAVNGEGRPGRVEFCKDVPAGLSLSFTAAQQSAAEAAAKKDCDTFKSYENQASSGCRVAGRASSAPAFCVALAVLGLAAASRRHRRAS
jgi:hypothetical protein